MEGRTSTDQEYRKAVYKKALDYIVDYSRNPCISETGMHDFTVQKE